MTSSLQIKTVLSGLNTFKSVVSTTKTTSTRCSRWNSKSKTVSSSFSSTFSSSSTFFSTSSQTHSTEYSTRSNHQTNDYDSSRNQSKKSNHPGYSIRDERFVLLSKLPKSITPHDIRSLVSTSQPQLNGSKQFKDITHVRILYTEYLNPSGKAIVTFSDKVRAKDFSKEIENRILSGKSTTTQLITSSEVTALLKPPLESPSIRLSKALIPSHSGRLVLLRGLPSTVTIKRLYSMLERYGLENEGLRWIEPKNLEIGLTVSSSSKGLSSSRNFGERDKGTEVEVERRDALPAIIQLEPFHDFSTSTSFLIRLKTPFSAFRLISRWNSSFWDENRTISRIKGRKLSKNSNLSLGLESNNNNNDITRSESESESESKFEEEDHQLLDDDDDGNDLLEEDLEILGSRNHDSHYDFEKVGMKREKISKGVENRNQKEDDFFQVSKFDLGGGVSQDGGGRLHVINAKVLY